MPAQQLSETHSESMVTWTVTSQVQPVLSPSNTDVTSDVI